jgi:hypothetical protein
LLFYLNIFFEQSLDIEELAEAVVIDPKSDPPFSPEYRLPDPNWIIEALSSLIVVSTRSRRPEHVGWTDPPGIVDVSIVSIAHFSVKEYLNSTRIRLGPAQSFYISEADAHHRIGEDCILYLEYYGFSTRNFHQNRASNTRDSSQGD